MEELQQELKKQLEPYLEGRAIFIDKMIADYLAVTGLNLSDIELVEWRGDPTIWFCRKRIEQEVQ